MLYSTKYQRLCQFSIFRFAFLQFVKIGRKNMSTDIVANIMDIDDTRKNNKRLNIDEGEAVAPKVHKAEDNDDAKNPIQRPKRKNYAIMMGYLGRDYYGMQRNPGVKTIEEDLLNALLKADLINADIFENVREIQFQRAARTDKGVSAARQVVSLKLPNAVDVAEINRYLPNEIRIFGMKRVTKGFNSKNQCDARTYKYILPTFVFAPEDSNILNTLRSDDEIDPEKMIEQLSTIDGKPYTEYRISKETLQKINSVTQSFEGTHNFHNFTSKVKPLDPRANRYVMSFQCTETFLSNNMEFAVLVIKGQSFMLHQIRKMVAVVIGMARNYLPDDFVSEAFKTEKMNMPIAPSLGLALNYVHYENYDKRYGSDGIHETLDWKECDEKVETFHKEYIIKHIVDTEVSDKTTLIWLSSCFPKYKDFRTADEEENVVL